MPRTLLLADDSETIRKVVAIVFAHEDFTVTAVANGDDAIARARELKPDIVLADVVMPGLDGYQVCEAIKADPSTQHIPVLLLAGTFEPFDEARASEVGADGHMPKPFESAKLVEKVKELVGAGPFDAQQGFEAAAGSPGAASAAPMGGATPTAPVAPTPPQRPSIPMPPGMAPFPPRAPQMSPPPFGAAPSFATPPAAPRAPAPASFGSAPAAPAPASFGSAPAAPAPAAFGSAPAAPAPAAFGNAPAAPAPASFGSAPAAPAPASFGTAPAAPAPASFGTAPAAPAPAFFGTPPAPAAPGSAGSVPPRFGAAPLAAPGELGSAGPQVQPPPFAPAPTVGMPRGEIAGGQMAPPPLRQPPAAGNPWGSPAPRAPSQPPSDGVGFPGGSPTAPAGAPFRASAPVARPTTGEGGWGAAPVGQRPPSSVIVPPAAPPAEPAFSSQATPPSPWSPMAHEPAAAPWDEEPLSPPAAEVAAAEEAAGAGDAAGVADWGMEEEISLDDEVHVDIDEETSAHLLGSSVEELASSNAPLHLDTDFSAGSGSEGVPEDPTAQEGLSAGSSAGFDEWAPTGSDERDSLSAVPSLELSRDWEAGTDTVSVEAPGVDASHEVDEHTPFLRGPSIEAFAPSTHSADIQPAGTHSADVDAPVAEADTSPVSTPEDGGEAALRAALSAASREVIERIAWEVVPQLAEVILREHVERLIKSREGRS